MSGRVVDVEEIARPFREEIRARVKALGAEIRLRGILASGRRASEVYSQYTERGCKDVGIAFEVVQVPRLQVEAAAVEANDDPNVHGTIVYYPVFGGVHDRTIQNLIRLDKDVEGLSADWVAKLFGNVRWADTDQKLKAILPCTPLGIVKALETLGAYQTGAPAGKQIEGRVATIFNRSEVVGRPLAAMLAHDGAKVYSFDVDGLLVYSGRNLSEATTSRAEALAESDIVITGVPSADFEQVRARELKPGAIVVNFSTFKNVADDVIERAEAFLPRVGPITVAMLLRNTLRLYENFHGPGKTGSARLASPPSS